MTVRAQSNISVLFSGTCFLWLIISVWCKSCNYRAFCLAFFWVSTLQGLHCISLNLSLLSLATNNMKMILKCMLNIGMSLKKYSLIPVLPGVCLIANVSSEIAGFMELFWQANCYEIWKKKLSSLFFPFILGNLVWFFSNMCNKNTSGASGIPAKSMYSSMKEVFTHQVYNFRSSLGELWFLGYNYRNKSMPADFCTSQLY